MKRTSLIYLLTFSLALNGATAVTVALCWWKSRSEAREVSLAQKPVKKFLREDLSLTNEQTKRILEHIDRTKPQFVKLSNLMSANRSAMMRLITTIPANVNAMEAKVGELNRIDRELRLVAVGTMLKVVESLPPGARAKFAAYLQERSRIYDGCPVKGAFEDR